MLSYCFCCWCVSSFTFLDKPAYIGLKSCGTAERLRLSCGWRRNESAIGDEYMKIVAGEFAECAVSDRAAASADDPNGIGGFRLIGIESEHNGGWRSLVRQMPVNFRAASYSVANADMDTLAGVSEFGGGSVGTIGASKIGRTNDDRRCGRRHRLMARRKAE